MIAAAAADSRLSFAVSGLCFLVRMIVKEKQDKRKEIRIEMGK